MSTTNETASGDNKPKEEETPKANGSTSNAAETAPPPSAPSAVSAAANDRPMTDGTGIDAKPAVNTTNGNKTKKEDGNEEKPEVSVSFSSDSKKQPASASASVTGSDFVDEDDVDPDEENLFKGLEQQQKEKEMEEALHPHAQPKDAASAPSLLRSALQNGEIKADESEEESENEAKKSKLGREGERVAQVSSTTAEKVGEAGPQEADDAQEHHAHARASQLNFLLSKASEYSSFISRDLDELQAAMSEDAQKQMEKAEKKSKKRKGEGKGKPSKKSKKNGGESVEALKSAQIKDAKMREKKKPVFIQPPNLSKGCELKDYQLEGVRWLASLFENGVSGILADEMGLGKTIQVIALIGHLLTQGVSGPFLIVAPLATLPNWVREFEKWLPVRPVVRYHGTAPEREAMMKGVLNPKQRKSQDFPFIVTSYEVAIRDQSKLEKLCDFTYLVVDEGHRLKNHRCTLLSSLKRIRAENRLLLTGTPIQNSLQELWSLLNFVNPSIFDDLSVFQSWFGFKDIGQKNRGATDEEAILLEQRTNQTVSKLHEILRPFLLRRVKTDVLSEMPPKRELVVYSGVSKLQAGYADLIEKGVLRETLLGQGIEQARNLSQTNKQMNHRKNINHPFLFGEPIDPNSGVHLGNAHPQLLVRASGKFALLDRMLTRLHADGHQVLIFSQMTAVLNILEDYLLFRNWKYCRIDGSTKIDERQTQMDVFNAEKTNGLNGTRNERDDRYFVFMLSTRAGGLGINLTGADTCIIFDSDWNPFSDAQAMDRCHRLGQTRPVAVYRLLTTNSVDIFMMEKQISKKKLERMTIAGGDFRKAGRRSRGDLDVENLSSLLKSDVQDLTAKGGDVEDIKISDEEFDMIMDRKRLFAKGAGAIPTEGKMYDIIDTDGSGDVLGTLDT